MKSNILTIRKSLNKAFLKVKPYRPEFETFKKNLLRFISQINESESEEFHKNVLSGFLKDTWYSPDHYINTKDRFDLVIHTGKKTESPVGVLFETKRPGDKTEMPSEDNLNTKAFHELLLYWLRERITGNNLEIKYLIATDMYDWFIFNAGEFERLFAGNKQLVRQFRDFEEGRLSGKTTDFFYRSIAGPFIARCDQEISVTHIDIRDYEKSIREGTGEDENKLIALYKIFSPEHLLKLPFTNDSNTLDKGFYNELLHIIGLKETKEGSKKLIGRKPEGERNTGSLIENAVNILQYEDCLSQVKDSGYGTGKEEQLYHIALDLVITWINRILFLKLLEGQLVRYNRGDENFRFLNAKRIPDYDTLNKLFFQVLAVKESERGEPVRQNFRNVPYLNSSLFEPGELEHKTVRISNLDDEPDISLLSASVLKDNTGKRISGRMNTLHYLFAFLDAYDFSGEGSEEIQEESKTLINASVLGLIFEKINGYKDGSFFTPGFITMYMCRETIRRAVVQKFNDAKGWSCETIPDVFNKIGDEKEANRIINSLKICDPAVGSGHFLVSALNEIIAIKSELKILLDREGRRLKYYHVEVANDELVVTDEDGELFEYNPGNKESQRVQEALFHEKQTLIENCLFGVDINPNSVKICRLRLWIELLKSAYYKTPESQGLTLSQSLTELETLPNIDINIKCGNSLISRYPLDADIRKALRNSRWSVDSYRVAVMTYRNAQNKEEKREMEKLITRIKSDFESEIAANDKRLIRLKKLKGELITLTTQTSMFEKTKAEKMRWEREVKKLAGSIEKLEKELEDIRNNRIYENAFEWRFEFPEVLNDDGDFVGFDVVIGNPPWGAYLSKNHKEYLKNEFQEIDSSTPNTFAYFIGLCLRIGLNYFTQVLPDSILVKDFSLTRENLIDKVYHIKWYQNTAIPEKYRPFLDVEHDVCIIFLKAQEPRNCNISLRFYKNGIIHEENVNESKNNFILKEYENVYNISLSKDDINILNKLRNEDTLNKFLQCHEGIHSGNIREKLFKTTKNSNYDKPMFLGAKNGDLINNYLSKRTGWYVDYREEIIDRGKNEYASLRDENIFINPKIYVTRTGNPFKAFIDKNNYASNNFFSIQFIDYDSNSLSSLKPILGFMNSKFANYYLRKIIAPSLGDTFIETKIIHLLKLPVKPGILGNVQLSQTIDKILEAKKKDPFAETIPLEAEIDRMVYELYGLTDEEIRIVEEAVRAHAMQYKHHCI